MKAKRRKELTPARVRPRAVGRKCECGSVNELRRIETECPHPRHAAKPTSEYISQKACSHGKAPNAWSSDCCTDSKRPKLNRARTPTRRSPAPAHRPRSHRSPQPGPALLLLSVRGCMKDCHLKRLKIMSKESLHLCHLWNQGSMLTRMSSRSFANRVAAV